MDERQPKYNTSHVAVNNAGHPNLRHPKTMTARKVSQHMLQLLEKMERSYEHAFNLVFPLEDQSLGILLTRTLLLAVSSVIETREDFMRFINAGYIALYEETENAIRIRKSLPAGAFILDYMDEEELATNIMRVQHTCSILARTQVQDLNTACQIHTDVSRTLRKLIVDKLGNTPPEDLPKARKSIEQVAKADERRRTQGMELWPELDAPTDPPPANHLKHSEDAPDGDGQE